MTMLRIGVDVRPLCAPFTGVSNYTLNLLRALLVNYPAINFYGYHSYRWNPIDEAFLHQHSVGAVESFAGPSRIAKGLRCVKGLPLIRGVARLMQGMAFGVRPGGGDLALFHAFQYVAPRQSVLPTIPVVYDLSFLRHPAWHPVSRLMALLPLADQCRGAPVVHTISAFTAAEIHSLLGVDRRRIHIIPPGVGAAFLEERPPQPTTLVAFDLRADGFFLAVGTLEPRKNLRTLIQSYARLPPSLRRRWPLCVAGPDGWGDMALPQEAAGLVEGGMLRFLGYLPVDDLRDLYCAAKVVLYPSLYEGFGMPVIEAMACGAPVVCSDAAAIPEAGGPLATYVSPLDVDAWTQVLAQAIESTASRDVELRGRRRAHALRFRWSLGAERAVGLYQAALAALR